MARSSVVARIRRRLPDPARTAAYGVRLRSLSEPHGSQKRNKKGPRQVGGAPALPGAKRPGDYQFVICVCGLSRGLKK